MDHYLNEQQVEELVNFDYVEQDPADLIDDEQKLDINDYLNSNIDYEMKPAEVLSNARDA